MLKTLSLKGYLSSFDNSYVSLLPIPSPSSTLSYGPLNPLPISSSYSIVMNLSYLDLNPPTPELLEKNINYAISPEKIMVEDLIFSIEFIINGLPSHETKEMWKQCGIILSCIKASKNNLLKDEFLAIYKLKDNPNILALKDDKGNTIVILNTSNYEAKLLQLLSSSSYRQLAKNPNHSITNLVLKAIKASSIDPQKNGSSPSTRWLLESTTNQKIIKRISP